LGSGFTSKDLIPIIHQKDGTYSLDFQDNHIVLKKLEEVSNLEKLISDAGRCPVRIDQNQYDELRTDAAQLSGWTSETLDRLMAERLGMWMDFADMKLANSDIDCYVCPGDDDNFIVDEVIRESKSVSNIDGKVLKIDGGYELLGSGWSITRRKAFRGCSEEDLSIKLTEIIDKLNNPASSIFAFHCPPLSSGLDDALDLETHPNQKLCGKITKPLGSVAVRKAIEKYQPLLGLHGHVHESRKATSIGRTLCINPGSIYEEGTLQGAVIDLDGERIRSYYMTSG
jgi:Icc-related predicted phosphoesterase